MPLPATISGLWNRFQGKLFPDPEGASGRVEAGHATFEVAVSINSPLLWYRARHRGPWKASRAPSGILTIWALAVGLRILPHMSLNLGFSGF